LTRRPLAFDLEFSIATGGSTGCVPIPPAGHRTFVCSRICSSPHRSRASPLSRLIRVEPNAHSVRPLPQTIDIPAPECGQHIFTCQCGQIVFAIRLRHNGRWGREQCTTILGRAIAWGGNPETAVPPRELGHPLLHRFWPCTCAGSYPCLLNVIRQCHDPSGRGLGKHVSEFSTPFESLARAVAELFRKWFFGICVRISRPHTIVGRTTSLYSADRPIATWRSGPKWKMMPRAHPQKSGGEMKESGKISYLVFLSVLKTATSALFSIRFFLDWVRRPGAFSG